MRQLQASNHPQGTEEWFRDRRGRLTGSDMRTIMNGGNRSWITLLERKKHEIEFPDEALGDEADAPSLRWGNENEPRAIAHYELIYNVDVERVGFVPHPTVPYVGCSPDFLNRDEGVVGETKCPYNEEVHAMTVVHGAGVQEYKPQIQCEIWVTGADVLHFISYDPRYRDPAKQLIVIPVLPDAAYIEKMEEKCAKFWDYLTTDTRPADFGGLDEIPKLF